MRAAIVAATVLTASLGIVAVSPAVQGPGTGAVAGRVTLATKPRGTPLASPIYPGRTVTAPAAPSTPEIENVIIYLKLKGAALRGDPPVMHRELHQRDEIFIPHVLAITRGSTVDFPNDDEFYHNVFSLSAAATFDLGRYPKGHSKTWTFPAAGLVKVYCHLHSQMSASILVLDHPYFTTAAADGAFAIKDIPPGEYAIVGWHERVGERSATVKIEAGKTATVNLSLPLEDVR
jgi:plastocyanin